MNHTITKRLVLYVVGLFLLALGSTLSIIANIGVSPVTSLAYALALTTGLSVGIMTVVANFIYIIFQVIFLKEIKWKNFSIQLMITFLFGSFMDVAMWLIKPLPDANSIWLIVLYFVLSLFLVAFALLFYFTAGLPTMPYDSLTYAVANKWNFPFGKTKMVSDMINVIVSIIICLVFIQSFGSIGIGTFIAAYGVGKLVGVVLTHLQPRLKAWVFKANEEEND